MPLPKSQTEFDPSVGFDPNRTPHNSPAADFVYWKHPQVGELMINKATKVVTPVPGKMYPQYPLRIPVELMAVDQPHIRTCGEPNKENKGCTAAVGGGCPILKQYGRVGPCNVIIEKHSKVDSVPCYMAYCGITVHGRPTSQAHYLMDGWRVLTDRTTIPENIIDPETRRMTVRQTEVPDLAPFYDAVKAAQAEKAEPKKKRGRPKKVVTEVAD